MVNFELDCLSKAADELEKIISRYRTKSKKEKEKASDIYILINGDKVYSESEIMEYYECDYFDSDTCDKYIRKLEQKKAKAGEQNGLTKSEMVANVLSNQLEKIQLEIGDIKLKEKKKAQFQERWEIAQKQGLSYEEFLNLEEVSRQSEEYEKLMGIGGAE